MSGRGAGNYGGFWDHTPERPLLPWFLGAIVAALVALMVAILYLIFFTHSKASPAADTLPQPTGPAPTTAPTTSRTLTVPASFGGYKKVTGATATSTLAELRKSPPGSGLRAVYSKSSTPDVHIVFLGMTSASAEVTALLTTEGVTTSHTYPAGPMAGMLRCGAGKAKAGDPVSVCAWTDDSTSALVVGPQSVSVKSLAKLAVSLRGAAER